ncbi:MAG TPA: sigma-70 family RNA polymerase sigma factor [Thermoanaerobaculia bacterium]|nr:sigma-70 family RNA polymerase sigma factor [Thermoanaerobaculia bacterium]
MKPIDAEEVFLTNLCLIDRAVGYVCHRNRVNRDEEEEFGSYVKFKLIESNYAIIRKFEGRSAFATYMTTVVQRMFFQYRVQMWGKWRPSAQAKRLGDKGITLERLLTRDGYTYSEAVAVLTAGCDPAFNADEIEAIYVRLPVRQPRPVLVSTIENTDNGPSVEPDLFSGERAVIAHHTAATIDAAIATMDAEDQLILRMRFWNALTIPQIASGLKLDDKKLYKRITKLLAQLKLTLEGAGVQAADAREVLDHSDHQLAFAYPAAEGKPEFRHSKPLGAVGGGQRQLRK